MQLPERLRAVLTDQRFRLGAALMIGFIWLALVIAAETGRNPAFAVIYGVPAVLILVWWRVRPPLALALGVAALMLVLLGNSMGVAIGGGPIIALSTSFFAILGASLDADQRVRWAGAAFAAALALVAFAGGFFGFVCVAFLAGIAVGGAAMWRQRRASGSLRFQLAQTTSRVDTAERDARLEVERNRIAREVHDVVAHSLAVVIAQADGARFAAETNPASVGPALEAIGDTARRALGEVRTMLHDLKASGGGVTPGASDIAALVSGVRELGVEVEEATFGEERPLEQEQGLALYRVAQEALTNAMRHGDRGEPVGFEVDWGERQVVLVVTNAVPAEVEAATERIGHGIEGMRERAADVGGDCSAGIGSNGRFRVRVSLPIAEPVADETDDETPTNPLIALFASQPEARRA